MVLVADGREWIGANCREVNFLVFVFVDFTDQDTREKEKHEFDALVVVRTRRYEGK